MAQFEMSEKAIQARKNRDYHDRLKGERRHEYGNCGGMAGLCPACNDDELTEMREWAKDLPSPLQNEDIVAYWHRVEGRFLDNWYTVAAEQYKRVGLAFTA